MENRQLQNLMILKSQNKISSTFMLTYFNKKYGY